MSTEDNSAYQRLQVISQDDLKRMEYEARMKAVRDQNQLVLEAKFSIAEQMLSAGCDIEFISRMTGFTEEQIKAFRL